MRGASCRTNVCSKLHGVIFAQLLAAQKSAFIIYNEEPFDPFLALDALNGLFNVGLQLSESRLCGNWFKCTMSWFEQAKSLPFLQQG